MKKLAVLLLSTVTLLSCVSKKSADKIAAEKDSLSMALYQKDSIINDVFSSLNLISENLDVIKSRENIVTANSATGDISREVKVKIQDDIQSINELLDQNRKTIDRLKYSSEKLRQANVKIAKLDDLVASLNKQVDAKDREIVILKDNLERLNIEVKTLNTEVETLNVSNKDLENTVSQQTDQLNTAFYIIGEEKELLDNGIVFKSGLVKKTLKIDGKYDLDKFTKINIKSVNEILINKKKVVVVSSHPVNSYDIVQNAKGVVEKIVIKDKSKFWETSKVLVISYK